MDNSKKIQKIRRKASMIASINLTRQSPHFVICMWFLAVVSVKLIVLSALIMPFAAFAVFIIGITSVFAAFISKHFFLEPLLFSPSNARPVKLPKKQNNYRWLITLMDTYSTDVTIASFFNNYYYVSFYRKDDAYLVTYKGKSLITDTFMLSPENTQSIHQSHKIDLSIDVYNSRLIINDQVFYFNFEAKKYCIWYGADLVSTPTSCNIQPIL